MNTNWTPEIDAQLGKMTDKELANKTGISEYTIGYRRRKLGIAGYNWKRLVWTQEKIARLGNEHDSHLADEWHCSREAIRLKRLELEIPPMKQGKTSVLIAPSLTDIMEAKQAGVFKLLSQIWLARFGEILTYDQLSELTGWSYSRMQKWFAPSTNQNLQRPIRQHMYLAVRYLKAIDADAAAVVASHNTLPDSGCR